MKNTVIVSLSIPIGTLTTSPESPVLQQEQPHVPLWHNSLSWASCSADRRAALSTSVSSHRWPLSHASNAPLLWGWSGQKRLDV